MSDDLHDPRLSEEIIEEIVVRLPVKSIIRCKCLSKSWFDLINSNRFIIKHLIHNKQSFPVIHSDISTRSSDDIKCFGICRYDDTSSSVVDNKWPAVLKFEIPSTPSSYHLAGNCNGIMCFSDYRDIFLVNPSLAEVKFLPGACNCRHMVGFGFDTTIDDFKIVKTVDYSVDVDVPRSVEVYDLRRNLWRELDVVIPILFTCVLNCPSISFNGLIHWFVYRYDEKRKRPLTRILTFDVVTELFSHIELPNECRYNNDKSYYRQLHVFNQEQKFLGFVTVSFGKLGKQRMNVWKLNDDQSWTQLYRSFLPPGGLDLPVSFSWMKHKILYTRNKKLVLCDLLDDQRSRHVVCDEYKLSMLRSFEEAGYGDDLMLFSMCAQVCRSCLVSIKT